MASFAAGLTLAGHHPAWPVAALVFFYASCIAFSWWPGIWLVAVPAGLPWLNFSPWTGWLAFEEFDLLLLAVFAGAYGRLAWIRAGDRRPGARRHSDIAFFILIAIFCVLGVTGLVRGFRDAGGFSFGWFQGYTDPLNSLRVFKSLLFALLAIPLLRGEMRESPERCSRRLALGMLLGLASVSLATLWERAAYPGLFDFSILYRVTALFWEMHVGGGAIDAYLAMAMPFVIGALVSARGPLRWGLAALLALLGAYACLTTFSRGAYLAVALPTLLVALARRNQIRGSDRGKGLPVMIKGGSASNRRMRAGWSLGLTVVVLAGTVLVGGNFLMARLSHMDRDIGGRMEHWRDGIGLLHSPSDWMLGLGLGRLPSNYARKVPDGAGELPGRVQLNEAGLEPPDGRRHVSLFGPETDAELGGLFALTQRVDIGAGGVYKINMDLRAPLATRLAIQVCERHLLYDWYCQEALVRVEGQPRQWRHRTVVLSGDQLNRGPWYAPRLGMLAISVLDPGASVDFYNISLSAANRKELLVNGDFSGGLAHWFPAAQYYFLPWHIDNLYLEMLIERGIAGLLVFAVLLMWALVRLLSGPGRRLWLSPYLASSLCGAVLIGGVSSLMDVPRVAFLLFLLIFFAFQLTGGDEPA